jgi:omega-hydroxy-beta-dihydromenaquinone-9 sulfotransferase
MTGQPASTHRTSHVPFKTHPYPAWSPRFWHGMRFGDWMRLLAENRFRIHPLRWAMVGLISSITPFNTVMSRVQRLWYGRRIDATPIQPPLFIIGHWRSGTTFLHELLVLDERFTFPTTYQCFAPEHFLLTEWLLARYCGFLLPKRRPMDNVRAGWLRPQEDEFALLTMGVRTPYRRMAFPNNPPPDLEYLNMEGVAEAELEKWCRAMRSFVQTLTYRDAKRVILKSPTHTGRVALLSQLFPGAQFIHITRDPRALFPSTRRLWKALDAVQGCQVPRHAYLDQYVYDALLRMYDGFEKQRAALDPAHLVDVRYEDLVADPVGVVAGIYQKLDLGDFSQTRDTLEAYVRSQPSYQTNCHQLAPDVSAEILRRWRRYAEQYGYVAADGDGTAEPQHT